jgi:hypothetical protein
MGPGIVMDWRSTSPTISGSPIEVTVMFVSAHMSARSSTA